MKRKPEPSAYQPCGVCGFCLKSLESEAGGANVRHADDRTPYKQCKQALAYPFSDVQAEKSTEF